MSVAAIQTHYGDDMKDNIARTLGFIEQAAGQGAQVILPSELFQGPYFCTDQKEEWFATAFPAATHPCVTALAPAAKALDVVIPVSIFEKDGPHYYNSIVMLDHDGEILGVYRKSHIPDGPGYQEKYYFRPGDTGYRVWRTRFGVLGVGICWDQWYPECARAMAMLGAEVLFYPTAIGSEPHDGSLDTRDPWRRAMQGHAVSNCIPVVASNRIGAENANGRPQTFYGSSFIADHRGDLAPR
jgi:N-carbamoylputrescine amidase